MDNKNEPTPTEELVNSEANIAENAQVPQTAQPNTASEQDVAVTHQQRMNSVYPTIQNNAANQQPLDTRNRFAPSVNDMDIKNIDMAEKKANPILGLVIVTVMLMIIATLSFLNRTSISNFAAGYTGGSYIDIDKTCPVLKNNISKMYIYSKNGLGLTITKNGDLYYLFIAASDGNKLGDCRKISGVSNVQDTEASSALKVLRLKDGKVITYWIKHDNDKYYATLLRTQAGYEPYQNIPLALSTNQYINAEDAISHNIKNYISSDTEMYFVDNDNNVYDRYFKKAIDGSVFDSAITPISSDDKYQNKQMTFKSDKFIYHFDSQGKFINKEEKLFGISPADVNQTYTNTGNEHYVMTNDGNFYLFKENSFSLKYLANSVFAGVSLLNIIIGTLLFAIAIMIIISYLSEHSNYFSGYGKIFGATLVIAILWAFVNRSLSLMPFVSTFIYFSFYFIVMKLVWLLMHKINSRSKLLFALIYILLISIICLATIFTIGLVWE